MADFTYQLSQPTNQIQPHTMPAEASGLGTVAQVAGQLLVPMVKEIKQRADTTQLDEMSDAMDQEFRTLAEARRQGKLTSSQFFSRLNVKARQLGADFPELAQQWRERVRTEFGENLQQQAFEAEVADLEIEDKVYEDTYAEALKFGLGVYQDGRINKDETVLRMQKLKRDQFLASTASQTGNASIVNQSMQTVINDSVDTIMGQIGALTGSEAEKAASATEIFNNAEALFMQQSLMPMLGKSQLKPTETKQLREEAQSQFDMYREYILGAEKGTLRDRQRRAKEVIDQFGTDASLIFSREIALQDALGSDAIGPSISRAMMFGTGQGESPQMSISRDLVGKMDKYQAVDYNTSVLAGDRRVSDVEPKFKPNTVGSLVDVEQNLRVKPKLEDKDQRAYLNSLRGLNDAAMESGAFNDRKKQLDILNKGAVFVHLNEGMNSSMADVADETVRGAAELSTDFLKKEQTELYKDVASDMSVLGSGVFALPAYNPSTGRLELEFNPVNTKKAALNRAQAMQSTLPFQAPIESVTQQGVESFMTSARQKTESTLKPYNDAIDVYVKSVRTKTGNKYSESVLRQFAMDALDYPTMKGFKKATGPVPDTEVGLPRLTIEQEEVTEAPQDNASE